MPIPSNPDARLSRQEAAEALTLAGYPIKYRTLVKLATLGGGPSYRLFGAKALYRWADLLSWAQQRETAPRASGAAA
jgi:hypothetical protein